MLDPLSHFDWRRLYQQYDKASSKGRHFQRNAARYLGAFQPAPSDDRALYYCLTGQFANCWGSGISLVCYEGMLYWKLYSQPKAVAKFCERLRSDPVLRQETTNELLRVSSSLPATLSRNADEIIRILTSLTKTLFGMASSCALPLRTTLLHFCYPDVVAIIDKQVLAAVGIREKNANQSYEVLREYLLHAWWLADKYRAEISIFTTESSVRVIDMALWLSRRK